jgi:hypothetical protein
MSKMANTSTSFALTSTRSSSPQSTTTAGPGEEGTSVSFHDAAWQQGERDAQFIAMADVGNSSGDPGENGAYLELDVTVEAIGGAVPGDESYWASRI